MRLMVADRQQHHTCTKHSAKAVQKEHPGFSPLRGFFFSFSTIFTFAERRNRLKFLHSEPLHATRYTMYVQATYVTADTQQYAVCDLIFGCIL